MKKFKVQITEVCSAWVEVEAECVEDAEEIAQEEYENGEYSPIMDKGYFNVEFYGQKEG